MLNAILSTYDCKRASVGYGTVYDDSGFELDQSQMLARILVQEATLMRSDGEFYLYYDYGSDSIVHDTSGKEPLISYGGYYVAYEDTALASKLYSSYISADRDYYPAYGNSYEEGSVMTEVYRHHNGIASTKVTLSDAVLKWSDSANAYVGYSTCSEPSFQYYVNSGVMDREGSLSAMSQDR